MPINHAVKLGLGLYVANAAGTRAGALTRHGNYLGVGAIGALGVLGVKMYQAVNDGVVDNSMMELLGNQVAAVIEPVSNLAAQFFNYGGITQLASYWAVSKLYAASAEPAQEDQEETFQRRAAKPEAKRQADENSSMPMQAYMMGGVPLNQIVRAGKGVVKRVLPGKVVTAMNVPFDLATRFAENVGMVTKGGMAAKPVTGLVSGIYGLAWGLLNKFSSVYQAAREDGPPLSII
jgi:hypothetical protein